MAGAELARRVARSHQDTENRKRLSCLANEIAADRRALLQLMRNAGVPVGGYKVLGGRLAEKASSPSSKSSASRQPPGYSAMGDRTRARWWPQPVFGGGEILVTGYMASFASGPGRRS